LWQKSRNEKPKRSPRRAWGNKAATKTKTFFTTKDTKDTKEEELKHGEQTDPGYAETRRSYGRADGLKRPHHPVV
jgi:hypothetical protein